MQARTIYARLSTHIPREKARVLELLAVKTGRKSTRDKEERVCVWARTRYTYTKR